MSKEILREAKNEITSLKKKAEVSPIREDLETIREDMRVLRDDTATLGQNLKVEGKKHLSAAGEQARQHMDTAKDKGQEYYGEMVSFVRNNPGQSVAFAFVGGMIASLLLGRRG